MNHFSIFTALQYQSAIVHPPHNGHQTTQPEHFDRNVLNNKLLVQLPDKY